MTNSELIDRIASSIGVPARLLIAVVEESDPIDWERLDAAAVEFYGNITHLVDQLTGAAMSMAYELNSLFAELDRPEWQALYRSMERKKHRKALRRKRRE